VRVRRRRRSARRTMRVLFPAARLVTHAPLLIHELERIRRERGWSVAALAQQIGVSAKLFYNMRLGHRPLSLGTLAEIARAFGSDYRIREAVIHYLALEYQTFGREILRDRAGGSRTAELPSSISYHNRWRIVTWIGQLPFGEGVQRGLYLVAAKPDTLSAVSRFLAGALGSRALAIAANTRPSASHAAATLAADVLLVDRVDFASEEVVALLSRRLEAHRPIVATSCIDRDAMQDGPLLRTLRAATEIVRLDARTPKTSRPTPARAR
jgi:transcriptional regulator with XRE-family HTH domain